MTCISWEKRRKPSSNHTGTGAENAGTTVQRYYRRSYAVSEFESNPLPKHNTLSVEGGLHQGSTI